MVSHTVRIVFEMVYYSFNFIKTKNNYIFISFFCIVYLFFTFKYLSNLELPSSKFCYSLGLPRLSFVNLYEDNFDDYSTAWHFLYAVTIACHSCRYVGKSWLNVGYLHFTLQLLLFLFFMNKCYTYLNVNSFVLSLTVFSVIYFFFYKKTLVLFDILEMVNREKNKSR